LVSKLRAPEEITLAEQEMPPRKIVEPLFPISRSNPLGVSDRGYNIVADHRLG